MPRSPTTSMLPSWIRKLAADPAGVDRLLAALALAIALPTLAIDPDGRSTLITPLAVGLVFVGCGALLARRRHPVPTLLAVGAVRLVLVAGTGFEHSMMPAVAIALYTVARTGDRRRALLIAVPAAVALSAATAATGQDDAFLVEFVGELALNLLPVAVADGARARADRIRDLIDAEADARVQAERLRIARDLHDVVAHSLATITVQSGVATHLLDSRPQQARESLEIITDAGKEALEELRTMVGVLRSTDEQRTDGGDDGVPLLPTPADPDDLSALTVGAARAGLTVDLQVDGRFSAEVSDAVVVATHRILQEALTNVARHAGTVPVVVEIRHHTDRVELRVSNDRPTPPVTSIPVTSIPGSSTPVNSVPSTGVGIIGMTERAESVGGTLRAGGREDGGFAVAAVLPYRGGAP